jgi:hypothetical protein
MLDETDSGLTEVLNCGHCGNKVRLIMLSHQMVKALEAHPIWEFDVEVHSTYTLCKCPVCEKITVRRDDDYSWAGDEKIRTNYLYPFQPELPKKLPSAVRRAYHEARAVKPQSANAYAVLLGRLLEAVCDDRGAKGEDLYKRLKDLAERGEIPAQLGQLAQRLRELRNVGAHAKQGELTAAHVPILDNMTRALLDYLYAVPSYLETAEDQLNQLKRLRQPK